MACAQGGVELPDDEESRRHLPTCLEAKRCTQGAQEAQTGAALTSCTAHGARFSCVLRLIYGHGRQCVQENLEREMLEEVCRLREMVDVLQQAVNDAETRAVNEREAAKDAIAQLEAASAIEETVVMVEDTEKVKSLSAEVDRLKVSPSHQFHPEIVQCGICALKIMA